MANGPIPYVDSLIASLLQANVAIPIVFTTVASVIAIVKAVGGPDVDLTELADKLKAQLDENDANGKAIIADLRAQNQS